jgi:hypothetical protein
MNKETQNTRKRTRSQFEQLYGPAIDGMNTPLPLVMRCPSADPDDMEACLEFNGITHEGQEIDYLYARFIGGEEGLSLVIDLQPVFWEVHKARLYEFGILSGETSCKRHDSIHQSTQQKNSVRKKRPSLKELICFFETYNHKTYDV